MSSKTRNFLSSLLTSIILITMITGMIIPAGLYAQEATEDPSVPEVTEEAPVATEAPTEEPTTEPEVIPTETPVSDITSIYSDFQGQDVSAWLLSAGWALGVDGDNVFLTASTPNETATANGVLWDDFTLSADVGLSAGNSVNIAFRVGAENYAVTLADTVSLYRSGALVAQGASTFAEGWHHIDLSVNGGNINVSVNAVIEIAYVDAAPLEAGMVVFGTGAANTGAIMLDNIVMQQTIVVVPEETPTEDVVIIPSDPVTPEPEMTDEVIIIPSDPVTPEPEMTEIVVEVTPEATDEVIIIPEATVDVEVTEAVVEETPVPETTEVVVEVTPEVTPAAEETDVVVEATVEVTPEVTPAAEETEVVVEATAEVTPDVEVTAEVTPAVEMTAEVTPEVEMTPEVTPEVGPAEIDETVPVLTADFEGETVEDWTLDEGVELVTFEEEENTVASLSAGSVIRPAEALELLDVKIELAANITAVEAVEGEDVENGIALAFNSVEGSSYLLTFQTNATTLYRNNGEGFEAVMSVPTEYAFDTWYNLSLESRTGQIYFSVDGEQLFAYIDGAQLAAGDISISAQSAVMVDDIAVYQLLPYVEEAPPAFEVIEELSVKFDGSMFNALRAYSEGDIEAFNQIIHKYVIPRDDTGRFYVTVYGRAGVSVEELTQAVIATGGEIDDVIDNLIIAYMPIEGLQPLAALDIVVAISRPPQASSTGNNASPSNAPLKNAAVGEIPHTLDILGVSGWHNVGITGSGVNVAVIDEGFGLGGSTTDLPAACLPNPTTVYNTGVQSGTHGQEVMEVICDVAPSAKLYQYAANATSTDDAIRAAAGINSAGDKIVNANGLNFPDAHVIVIALDPTDTDAAAIDDAINDAYAVGVVVVASAGNRGGSASVSFTAPASGTSATTTLFITATAGSVITIDATSGTAGATAANMLNEDWDDTRPAASDPQTYDISDTGGGSAGDYCGVTCQIEIVITNDTSATDYTVTVSNGGSVQVDNTATSIVGASQLTPAAASDGAISVAAVCSWTGNFNVLTDSSNGAAGQSNNSDIKPSLSAPSVVHTSANPFVSGSVAECATANGFSGTSAAAAHVGGMAALILSNGNLNGTYNTPAMVKQYLQTRSIDLHAGANPDGFDNVYGSGLAQLGDPTFNPSNELYVNRAASTFSVATDVYYVTTAAGYDPSGTQDGSYTNPFTHPEYAMYLASITGGKDTVVFMPGEYVTPYNVPSGVELWSYDIADTAVSTTSVIWVNNMHNRSGGGMHMDGVSSVRITGFTFNGASPDYEWEYMASSAVTLADVTPFGINNSSGVQIDNNVFNNFDAPSLIDSSANQNIIENNEFNNYTAREFIFNSGQSASPLHPSAVLNIDSSGTTSRILIRNNDFNMNTARRAYNTGSGDVSAESGATRSIINVKASGVEIYNNHFYDNYAPAMIGVDQWIDKSSNSRVATSVEVRIFGNVFDGEYASGYMPPWPAAYTDDDGIQGDGAIVNLYQGQRFQFVNNTIVNFGGTDSSVNIINVGDSSSVAGDVTDHRFELHNNLVFNITTPGAFIVPISSNVTYQNVGCTNIAGTANAGLKNNWLVSLPTAWTGGTCPIDGSNRTGTEGENVSNFRLTYFFYNYDPADPYRLMPSEFIGDVSDVNFGIDLGLDTAAEAVFGSPLENYDDILGAPRRIEDDVDAGAYEIAASTDPIALDGGRPNLDGIFTGSEDNVLIIPLDNRIIDGWAPYNFSLASGSSLPQYYDPDPGNLCLGQPIYIDNVKKEARYCPPDDFYTEGATPALPALTFTYQAVDTFYGVQNTNTVTEQITIKINPVDDGQPAPGTTTNSRKYIKMFQEVGSVSIPLRPYETYSAPEILFSDADAVDWDFSFSNFTTTQNVCSTGCGAGNGSDPLVDTTTVLNPAYTGATSGTFALAVTQGKTGKITFDYDVTDTAGSDVGYYTVEIVFVPYIRDKDPGIYDDTDLAWDYDDGVWSPLYYATGYNNTMHYSTAASASTTFGLLGDEFGIQYLGYAGSPNIQITIDADNNGTFETDLDDLTCNYVKSSYVNTVSDVTTVATAQTNGITNFGCTGLETVAEGELHVVKLTTVGAGFYLDAIHVRDGGFGPGEFLNERDFGYTYGGTWPAQAVISGYAGNTLSYTNVYGNSVKFQVDTTRVDSMVIYRTMGAATAWDDLKVELADDEGFTTNKRTIQISSANATTAAAQPYIFRGFDTNTWVRISKWSNDARYLGFEGVEFVEPLSDVLTAGRYLASDSRIEHFGTWATYASASTIDGEGSYSGSPSASLMFKMYGQGVTVYRTISNSAWIGSFEMCIDDTCETFTNSASATLFSRPATLFASSSGEHIVTIRYNGGGYFGPESIEVFDSLQVLTPGVYNDDDIALTYSGNWTALVSASAINGTMMYDDKTATASVRFYVDADDMDNLIIHHLKYSSATQNWAAPRVRVNGGSEIIGNISSNGTYWGETATFSKVNDLGNPSGITLIELVGVSGAFTNVEAIEIDGTPIPLVPREALYNDTHVAFSPNSFTALNNAASAGGSWRYTNVYDTTPDEFTTEYTPINDTDIIFEIDASVDSMVLYRTMGAASGWDDIKVELNTSADFTSPARTVQVPSTYAATVYNQPYIITDIGSNTWVRISKWSNDARYISFEGIKLLDEIDAGDVLQEGNRYLASDSKIRHFGTWTSYPNAYAIDGETYYSGDTNASMMFKFNGQGIAVYRIVSNSGWIGSFEICIDGITPADCETFSNKAGSSIYGRPAVMYASSPGEHTATIRYLGGGYFGPESIEVLGAPTVLTEGIYYEDDLNISTPGPWTTLLNGTAVGGSAIYDDGTGTATAQFWIDTNDMDELVIHHVFTTGWGAPKAYNLTDDPTSTSIISGAAGNEGTIWGETTTFTAGQFGAAGVKLVELTWPVTIPATLGSIEAVEIRKTGTGLVPSDDLYNDDYFKFTYNPPAPNNTWTALANAASAGGSWHFTKDKNDTVIFNIDASVDSMVIYRTMGAAGAWDNIEVTLDTQSDFLSGNEVTKIVPGTNSTTVYNQPYIIPNVGSNTYVRIRKATNDNLTYIGFEGIRLLAEIPTDTGTYTLQAGTRYLASDGRIRDFGNWVTYPNAKAIDGEAYYSADPSASMMFKFDGYGFAIYRIVSNSAWNGSFEVCIVEEDNCRTFYNYGGSEIWSRPAVMYPDGGEGVYTVTVRHLGGGYIGLESVEILGNEILSPGRYNDDDVKISYTGQWTVLASASAKSGTVVYDKGTGTSSVVITVNADSMAATGPALTIYHLELAGTPNWSGPTVKVNNVTPTGDPDGTTTATTTGWGSTTTFSKADLDNPTGNVEITLTWPSGTYGNIEAIEIGGDKAPLTPGYYEQDDFDITLNGSGWAGNENVPSAVYSGGSVSYTDTQDDSVSFQIGGGTTGFTVFLSAGTFAPSSVELCIKRDSTEPPATPCANTEWTRTINPSLVSGNIYGFSVVGLPHLVDTTSTVLETYTVTIRHDDPDPSKLLLFDSVAVLGVPDTALTAGLYGDNESSIQYQPSPYWITGAAAGWIGDSYSYATLAGATAQFKVTGNSVTLYHYVYSGGSTQVRFCVAQGNGKNNTDPSCTTYSVNSAASVAQSPITFYGLGTGDHIITIENLSHGKSLFIDGIEVH